MLWHALRAVTLDKVSVAARFRQDQSPLAVGARMGAQLRKGMDVAVGPRQPMGCDHIDASPPRAGHPAIGAEFVDGQSRGTQHQSGI
jgi:hypothetical protein